MATSPHVLIIGAGLCGPSLALGLARHKIRSTIFERHSTPQNIGGVLMLAPNAVRVLDKVLGIEEEVRNVGFNFDAIKLYIDSGRSMDPMGKFGFSEYSGANEKAGYRGITLKRPLFHDKLLELCKQQSEWIDIKFSKKLSKIEETDQGVSAVFEDGTRADGDILLGTDGIHSKVRDHVLGDSAPDFAPRFIGAVTLGSRLDRSQLNMESEILDHPSFLYTQAGTMLLFPTGGTSLQWASFVPSEERDRHAWNEYRTSGQALERLREEWKDIQSEPAKSLIAHATSENMLLWAPYQVPEIPTWHTDRVCLLGDSCHAISPSGGQGTAQALEDAGLMVLLLSNPAAMSRGYPALFAHFEQARRARLEHIKKFTDRSQATRYPTPSGWAWWFKRIAYKAVFAAISWGGDFRGNKTITYDVTQESLDVK